MYELFGIQYSPGHFAQPNDHGINVTSESEENEPDIRLIETLQDISLHFAQIDARLCLLPPCLV